MVKIVILGSCRFEPYDILFTPKKIKGKWNTEEGYIIASKKCYKDIEEADEIWVYAPDGIGGHTQRDINYALSIGKKIHIIGDSK